MAIDPICGMTVDPATAAGQYEYQGATYYFCAKSCLETFKADPERALRPVAPALMTIGKPSAIPMMPHRPAADGGHLDPVCGMTVRPEDAAGSYVHEGKTTTFVRRTASPSFVRIPPPF
jgi:Cu+-exporting ATPase